MARFFQAVLFRPNFVAPVDNGIERPKELRILKRKPWAETTNYTLPMLASADRQEDDKNKHPELCC